MEWLRAKGVSIHVEAASDKVNDKPANPVSTLRKNPHRVDCELKFHGESYGWECLCLYDGELAYGRRFLVRAHAVEEAKRHRTRLLGEGWS
jgi:hypothetical protein